MKKLILLFLFICTFSAMHSQNAPIAVVNADKMNMLYIGLDNPITVNVPGTPPDKVDVTINGGAELKSTGGGHYVIKPDGSKREIEVKVAVKQEDGTIKIAGSKTYRIRKIPHPEVLFGTKNGGMISKGEIAAVSQINSGLGEGFAFEGLRFTVNSYTLIIAKTKGQNYIEQVQGNRISAAGKDALLSAEPGDYIVISGVDATGPVGKVVLSGVSLQVK